MARIDDYENARKLAIENLSGESAENISRRTGLELKNGNILKIPFLDKVYDVAFPGMVFKQKSEDGLTDAPIQEQVLILHYLLGSRRQNIIVSPRWASYREIPGASFYYSAFVKRAVNTLKNTFGENIAGFKKAAERLNGKPVAPGDAAFEFTPFPGVPLQLVLWEGDEEFPAEANILFDAAIGSILSPEDIAWLAGMLVYRLAALSKSA
jgi:hypothetical protein